MILENSVLFVGCLIWGVTALYILLTTLYLLILTVAAYRFKPCWKTRPPQAMDRPGNKEQSLKMLLIIPAHNEAMDISRTLQNMSRLNTPEDHVGILVIADNCTDETAALARQAGADVVERKDLSARGKGQALNWFFTQHKAYYEAWDAVVIIDADTRPHPDFLSETARSLYHTDVSVVQGFYGVSNPEESWRTALSEAALDVFHHIRPAGRNAIGGTAGLKGNGMAFRTEVVAHYGWPAFSIVEDIEMSLMLLLDGIRVYYNPDAVVYGEMAAGGDQADSQRKRWEGGRLQLLKQYTMPLIKALFSRQPPSDKVGRIAFIDGIMELLTPPLSLLVMGQGIFFMLSVLFLTLPALQGVATHHPIAFQWMPIMGLFCPLVTLFYIASGLILKKAPRYVWMALLWAPVFILWKIPIYLNLMKKKTPTSWERTRRSAEENARKKRNIK